MRMVEVPCREPGPWLTTGDTQLHVDDDARRTRIKFRVNIEYPQENAIAGPGRHKYLKNKTENKKEAGQFLTGR